VPRYSIKDEFDALDKALADFNDAIEAMEDIDEALLNLNDVLTGADLLLETEKKKPVGSPKFTTRPGREMKEFMDQRFGYTPLHSAARDNKIKIVQELIAAGADLNIKDHMGMTPLILAAEHGQTEVVRLLIDAGADIQLKDNAGRTARDRADRDEIAKILKEAPKRQKQLAEERAAAAAAAKEKETTDYVRSLYLKSLITTSNCEKVREILDQSFWESKEVPFEWEHLKIALEGKDRSMMRLLITWGATVDANELTELTAGQVTLLRQCGWRPTEELPVPKPEDPFKNHCIEALPDEWLRVLQALQTRGAHEAVIAGGAVRDIFNDAEVRDVDIFLQSRGNPKKNKKFLQEVFKDTKLEIIKQDSMLGYDAKPEAFPDPKIRKSDDGMDGSFTDGKSVESWTIIAGPQRTEYNIVFLDGPMKWVSNMIGPMWPITRGGEKRPDPPVDFAQKLIGRFDFGLCQVACDGEKIIMTKAYKNDALNKKLTAVNPNPGTYDHQLRLARKYPDWALQGVEAPKQPAPAYSGYSFSRRQQDWSSS
jgi:hypothetical protein